LVRPPRKFSSIAGNSSKGNRVRILGTSVQPKLENETSETHNERIAIKRNAQEEDVEQTASFTIR